LQSLTDAESEQMFEMSTSFSNTGAYMFTPLVKGVDMGVLFTHTNGNQTAMNCQDP